jgi:hypothetical protein
LNWIICIFMIWLIITSKLIWRWRFFHFRALFLQIMCIRHLLDSTYREFFLNISLNILLISAWVWQLNEVVIFKYLGILFLHFNVLIMNHAFQVNQFLFFFFYNFNKNIFMFNWLLVFYSYNFRLLFLLHLCKSVFKIIKFIIILEY